MCQKKIKNCSLENPKSCGGSGFHVRLRLPHFHEESALNSILPFLVPSCIFSVCFAAVVNFEDINPF